MRATLISTAVLPVVIEEQRFGAALSFVVARAHAHRIDVAPVRLRLRVDLRIAVHLAGRCLEDAATQPLGEPKHVDRAVDRSLRRLHRVVLVVDRRRGTSEVVDFVHLDIQRKRHVVTDELESRIAVQVVDVPLCAREQVIHAQHLVPETEQAVAQVRPEEACAAGDEDPLAGIVVAHSVSRRGAA